MKAKATFLGGRMSQTPMAISMWEQILVQLDFKRIIELGTTHGNLSHFFLLFCKRRNAEFYTYDHKDYPKAEEVRGNFFKKDIFESEKEIGEILRQEGLTILFCDNGNKPLEVETFRKYMKKGDIIAVHDWMTEIFPEDVKGLKEVFVKQSEADGMTRFFEV